MSENLNAADRLRTFLPVHIAARLLPLLALCVFGTLFLRHIMVLDSAAIWAAMAALAGWQWAAALVFTALSFRAIGVYDVLVHCVLQTRQSPAVARSAGVKAIALSQTLGFGAVTSALVRWRCLPDLSAGAIARLSAVVSLSFLAALAVIAALVVPLSGLVPRSDGLLLGGLVALSALVLLARLSYRLGWIPIPVRASTLIALLFVAAADTGFAAAALWVLWPDAVSFHLLFAAYLVALGAGLLSNAPGGVGAFDLSLLAMLPITDSAATMAALLAFRVIYYALPATIALICLIRPTQVQTHRGLKHPEVALAQQSARIFHHNKTPLLTLPCWGNGAILGDLPTTLSVADLNSSAAPRALYKCSAQQAIQARDIGWQVIRCASEATIDLTTWSTFGPAKRQLRRALKGFDAAGLQIRDVRDMASLSAVAAGWADTNGGERGLSMGRFCPDYLRHQRVFAAFDGPTPVAFVSFHTGDVWTLDLMRHGPLPCGASLSSGTMHALVHAGINAAIRDSIRTLSLAAVPAPAPNLPFAARTLETSSGLRRFKQTFAPNWQPRYLCAPTRAHLVFTAATLAHAIHNPPPVPNPNSIQRHHEDFSIAPPPTPCEARVTP